MVIQKRIYEITISKEEEIKQDKLKIILMRKAELINEKLPLVIVLHGTGADKEHQQLKPITIPLIQNNFEVLTMDSRYHGERANGKTKEEKRESYMQALIRSWKYEKSEVRQEFPFIFDTVFDIMRVIDYLEQNQSDVIDIKKIGITGISLGGMHSWFSAVADPRISVVVPLIGVQNFQFALENDLWKERVETIKDVFEVAKVDLGKKEIDRYVVEKVWDKITPGILNYFDSTSSLRCIAPRPLLILNGEIDLRCPKQGIEISYSFLLEYYNLLGVPDHCKLFFASNIGHAITDEQFQMTINWFVQHLQKSNLS